MQLALYEQVLVIRPHRMYKLERYGLLLQMSACLLVATVSSTKWLNRSRCRLEYGLGLHKNRVLNAGPDPPLWVDK